MKDSNKKLSAGEKAAKINGKHIIIATIITVIGTGLFTLLTNSRRNSQSIETQSIKQQRTDSGTINNYTTNRDNKIESKTYNNTVSNDTLKSLTKRSKQKIESKNQIINNAPNQGVQINENKGTVVVQKPLQRSFTIKEAKKILENYPTDFPIKICLNGTTLESKRLFDQVVEVINQLGYTNISTTVIGFYASTEVINKDFQYKIDNGKLIISIFPQQ